MAWLSMYPHERELTFNPLTGLEVQGTCVEGSLLKVFVRLSVNLAAPTIEQVLSKRKKVVQQMCSHMSESLKRELDGAEWPAFQKLLERKHLEGEGVIKTAQSRLKKDLERVCRPDATHFNDDSAMASSINEAVQARQAINYPGGLDRLLEAEFGAAERIVEEGGKRVLIRGITKSLKNLTDPELLLRQVSSGVESVVSTGEEVVSDLVDASKEAGAALVAVSKKKLALVSPGRATGRQSPVSVHFEEVMVKKEWEQALRFLQHSKAHQLDFGRKGIGNAGLGALSLLLNNVPGSLKGVTKLLLDRCDLGAAGVAALASALADGALPGLHRLCLAQNRILDTGLVALAKLAIGVGAIPELKELSLEQTGFGDEGFIQLCLALAPPNGGSTARSPRDRREAGCRLSELEELELSDNEVSYEGCKALAAAFDKGALPLLEKLNFGGNSLNNEAIAVLAPSLGHLEKLSELSLDDNLIEDKGVIELSKAIKKLNALTMLALDDNLITDVGAIELVKSASDTSVLPCLVTLDLDGNEIGEEGFGALATVLKKGGMKVLQTLEVDDDMLTGHAEHNNLIRVCKERNISLR